MSTFLLGIDVGTSGCKVALFDETGVAIAQAMHSYPVNYPSPGWAEQDPDSWWLAACKGIRDVIAKSGVNPTNIAGIGVDGQSWSAIAINKDGNVLAPTPIWTDTRAQSICEDTVRKIPESRLFAVCGNPIKPSYTLPKILWYKEHTPDVYSGADKILQSNSFIVYRLTGMVTQDVSQGYGLACFDMRRLRWDESLCRELDIRPSLLPEIYPSHQIVGKITRDASAQTGLLEGAPVVAGGLDAACGTLGAGVIAHGQTQEQGGQAGGMSICLDKYAADPRLILSAHVVPDRWLLQGGTTGGGGALKWLRETICPDLDFVEMSREAGTIPAGSDGITFLPYMAGERSPIWNPDACGVFFGLRYASARGRLIRAVMEGVAYSLRHNLETAEDAGASVGVLRAMGGAANSAVWTQIKADVTGHTIETPASDTATTLGAAMLAGVGAGVFRSFEEAVSTTVKINRTYHPDCSKMEIYNKGYSHYRELYERLSPMMTSDNTN